MFAGRQVLAAMLLRSGWHGWFACPITCVKGI
jgi:hypothetical protein